MGIVLFTLATALTTAFSRIPIDRPFAQAIETAGRYVNFGAHYWAALIVLTAAVVAHENRRAAWLSLIVFVAAFAIVFPRTGDWVLRWMNHYALYQDATLAIESGVKVT